MKNVSFVEFDHIVRDAQRFIGATVESVVFDHDILLLGLRTQKGSAALLVDVRNRVPFFMITDKKTPRLKSEIKPIVLFLRAHAIGLQLLKVDRQAEYGRLIECQFGRDDKHLVLEAHLFPQGKNIKVKTKDSEVCLKKPHPLTKMEDSGRVFETRALDEIYKEWIAQFDPTPIPKTDASALLKEQTITKKRAGLEKLIGNRKPLEESLWPEFAEWLNRERTDIVPKKYTELYDPELSVVQNIEHAFSESKKIKSKRVHLEERILELEQEIVRLENEDISQVVSSRPPPVSPLEGAKGRTREFAHGIRAYIGKSGTDNLKILRQSKSWYIWVHAKDWPSAHAIIATNKGQEVPHEVLRDVCLWVLKETISDKQWQSWLGIKVDFLYTERRFLQPIKGDHHGRVRYSESKTITVVVE